MTGAGLALDTFVYALVALLVILDPPGTAALFAALTPNDTPAERGSQARRACLIAFLVLAVFGLAGQGLLAALGIGLPAMKAAGGVLLFLTAADMVSARRVLRASPEERAAATRTEEDIAVFPLAIPLIAGPGAMTTMVLLHARAGGSLVATGAVLAALVVAIAATLALLLSARWIARLLARRAATWWAVCWACCWLRWRRSSPSRACARRSGCIDRFRPVPRPGAGWSASGTRAVAGGVHRQYRPVRGLPHHLARAAVADQAWCCRTDCRSPAKS